jgi:exonuclease III
MRIIAWNCQMAFRQKYAAAQELQPDILVISESESPEFLQAMDAELPWPNQLWIGDNPTKGLSVFATAEYKLQLKATYNPDFRFVAPIEVVGPQGAFDLYAVWTQGEKTLSKAYVTHILNAMRHYQSDIDQDAIILGDFNSNPVFKQNGKKHLELVHLFGENGFNSIYHRGMDEVHGMETTPTFYLHRNLARPYHLDYVFCDKFRDARLYVGDPKHWLTLSDHMPLVADFNARSRSGV